MPIIAMIPITMIKTAILPIISQVFNSYPLYYSLFYSSGSGIGEGVGCGSWSGSCSSSSSGVGDGDGV